MKKLSLALLICSCWITTAWADNSVDISDLRSMEFQGDPLNDVLLVDLAALLGQPSGTDVELLGVSFDVIMSTVGSSWASDAQIGVDWDGDTAPNVTLPVAPGVNNTVVSQNFTGGTSLDPVIVAGGELSVEFFEIGFNDNVGSADALYLTGSTMEFDIVPEPTSVCLWLMGLGLVWCGRRR